jgi:hypothetical protein
MRDRADFICNLKEAYTHLLIMTEDIKYPLSEERQKWLDGATLLIGHLHSEIMKEDIEAALRAMAATNLKGDSYDD